MIDVTHRGSKDEPPYARYAFLNPYNLSVFVGLIVLGLATGNTWVSILACGAEAMWLIFAPDSRLLRALWFDRVFAASKVADDAERLREKVTRLSPNDSTRLAQLRAQRHVLEQLVQENPSLTAELLAKEFAKIGVLLDDFIGLGATAARAERHAATFDFNAMNRSFQMYEAQCRSLVAGDLRRDVAERNIEVLRRRRARYDDVRRVIQVARGQMDLIEQTLRLLGDEIVTMANPSELEGRIDELRTTVDAVRGTTDEAYWAALVETDESSEPASVKRAV